MAVEKNHIFNPIAREVGKGSHDMGKKADPKGTQSMRLSMLASTTDGVELTSFFNSLAVVLLCSNSSKSKLCEGFFLALSI